MKTIKLTHGNLEEVAATAVEFLQEGGVVVMPMDTSYGVAADATNLAAVDDVIRIKGRAPDKAMSVVIPDRQHAERIANLTPAAARLWDVFMPGSLTIIVPVADESGLADATMDNGRTVGLRQPNSELVQEIAERLERPFTATSANVSGKPPAYTAQEFIDSLPDDRMPHLVIDGGSLSIGPLSTVVSAVGKVEILREGAIPTDQIMAAAGPE
jgi:L-threonylcarbamoyladenylate synthase